MKWRRRRCGKQYIGMKCAPLEQHIGMKWRRRRCGKRSGLKDAPQRRVYPRSLARGPIDVSTGEAVRPCARPKDAYFRTAGTRFQAGVRLTLILFIYQCTNVRTLAYIGTGATTLETPGAVTEWTAARTDGLDGPMSARFDHLPRVCTRMQTQAAPFRAQSTRRNLGRHVPFGAWPWHAQGHATFARAELASLRGPAALGGWGNGRRGSSRCAGKEPLNGELFARRPRERCG
eukprot:gene5736-biopygen2777